MTKHHRWTRQEIPARLATVLCAGALAWGSVPAGAAIVDLGISLTALGQVGYVDPIDDDVDRSFSAEFGAFRELRSLSGGNLVAGNAYHAAPAGSFDRVLPAPCSDPRICSRATWDLSGASTLSARADFGGLGVAAQVNYSVTSDGGSGFNNYGGTAVASYTERISLNSPTLAIGAPASFSVLSLVHGSVSNIFGASLGVGYRGTVWRPSTGETLALPSFNWGFDWSGAALQLAFREFDAQVGDEVTLTVMLGGSATLFYSGTESAQAMNSLATQISPRTAGLALAMASGHDYSAVAVPEPRAWVLLLLGLGALAVGARRRAGARSAAA